MKESSKARIEYCEDSTKSSAYFRAIQRHPEGIPIDPKLMGYIRIPDNWKKYLCHRGCSFSIHSFLENGLIPGGHGGDKGRHTVFFTPGNPFGGDFHDLVMITLFLRKCTTTVVRNEIKMPLTG